ncbi:DNA-binding capsular synthesis response regulator RcsB [Cupriavidus basilensis]|uniref:DNA-binding capsular synthesis response regulator RcsB n=2 Tax=Cupriavidus basilensis TaxID=68895 RepID=A0A0C4YCG4_9BURK|nr:DNA-binding capsular synthesis response regulator RcsB [Cupriavidus basilensis]
MGIREVIERDLRFVVVDSASGPSDLIAKIPVARPDIIVTDFAMPGDLVFGDGLRLIEYLARTFPGVKLLVLTMLTNPIIVSALYDAGAHGVVLKGDSLNDILAALFAIRSGRRYIPSSLQETLRASSGADSIGERIKMLSPREYEVLRHFVGGDSVQDIARHFSRSVKTVSGHKVSAMQKLGVTTDQQLIAFCIATDLFQ